jgi:hypothetical protein
MIAFLFTLLGMEGFFRYTRTRTASAFGPALIAPLFAGNGFFAYAYFSGWLNFYSFQLLPWILLGVDGTFRARRYGPLILAISTAFIVGFGGTYTAPLAFVLSCAHLLRILFECRNRPPKQIARALAWLLFATYLAFLLSAFRIWPVVESLIAGPRVMAGVPRESLVSLDSRLFRIAAPRLGNYVSAGQFYAGLSAIPLVALGLMRKRALPLLAVIPLWAWVATGYQYSPYAPFALLRELPVYSTLRYPERFLFLACLAGYEIAALGIDALVLGTRRKQNVLRVLSGVALVAAISLAAFTIRAEAENARIAAAGMWLGPEPIEIAQPFRQTRGNRWLAAHYPPLNRGSLSCWEAYAVPMSPWLRSDLPEEEYLTDATAGQVTRTFWSPNRLEFDIDLARPAVLHINQNWHPGWKSNLGEVRSREGLLTVELPKGCHQLRLRFLPRSALFGFAISLIALAALIALTVDRKRLAWVLSLIIAPLLFAASFIFYAEPLPAATAPRNADGTLIITDALPTTARRLRVQFELPVVLEGVEIPRAADRSGLSHFALYFRVQGPVPRTLGVSVHFVSNKRRTHNADHQVIGSTLYLSEAPRGVLLRDAFSRNLQSKPGERWKMYISLWHASGDRKRVRIRSAEGVQTNNDRALVGAF